MIPRIGKFEILRRLGEGAMGEVFLATDPVIGREVAIKTIRKDSVALGEAKEEARGRFYREARAAGGLNHPNLVTVHEFGEDQGLLYLAMEYVPGEDLATLLQRRSLTPREILDVLAQVCDGLAYAHSRGVLHRDIKPTNIRVGRLQGRLFAKVMDFGIARIGGSDMTGTGTLLGTFGYMAPEYIQSGIPAPSADLFAVGVILYEALAGRRPFVGDTTATVLYRIVHDAPAPLDLTGLPEVSASLQDIVMRALSKNPGERFTSAESLAAALRGALDPTWRGPTDHAPTVQVPRPGPGTSGTTAGRPAPRRGRGIWVAAGLLLLASGGAWAWLRGRAEVAPIQAAPAVPAQPPPTSPAAEVPIPAPAPPAAHPEPAARVEAPRPIAPPDTAAPAPGPAPALPTKPDLPIDEGAEAPAHLQGDPLATLRWSEEMLRTFPGNAKALALRVVALYDLGRYGEIPGALQASVASGVPIRALFRFPRFVHMVQEESRARRLPEPVRAQLEQLPGGRGEGLRRPLPDRRTFRFRN